MATNDSWKEYTKIAAKRRRFLRRVEARGYRFSDDIYKYTNRQNVADPNVAIEYLNQLTPEYFYSHSFYLLDPSTGEVVSGTEGRKIERAYATLKAIRTKRQRAIPDWSESVLSATYENLDKLGSISWRNDGNHVYNASMVVRKYIDDVRDKYGDGVAARVIVNMERSGHPINFDLLYKMDTIQGYAEFSNAFQRELSKYVKVNPNDFSGTLEDI